MKPGQVVAVTALIGVLCGGAWAQEQPDLLHVSWEGTQEAEFAIGHAAPAKLAPDGRHDYEPGPFGQAFVLLHRGSVGPFDAAGNYSVRSGSLVMWYRPHQVVREMQPVLVTSIDRGYYYQLMRVRLFPERLECIFYDDYLGWNQVSGTFPRLEPGKWIHLGFVWDAGQGQRLYLNGELIGSTWGEQGWPTRSVYADSITLPVRPSAPVDGRGDAVDELWTFSRPLTDDEMKQLHETNQPPTAGAPPLPDEGLAERRREEFGWDRPEELPRLGGEGLLRQVPFTEVYQGTKRVGCAADGKIGTRHPHRYHGVFDGGGCLGIGLAGDYDHMVIVGNYDGFVYPGRHPWTPEGVKPIWDIDMKEAGLYRGSFDERQTQRELTFQGGRGSIAEIAFFATDAHTPTAQKIELQLAPADPSQAAGELTAELFSQYPQGDRTCLAPGGAGRALTLPAYRFLHVLVPAREQTTAVAAFSLRIPALGLKGDVPCNLVLVDPLCPWRRHLLVDALVECDGSLSMTLDTVDLMLSPGQRLWLTLAFGEELEMPAGEHATLTLLAGDRNKVQEEYCEYRLRLLKTLFNELSEPRGWQTHREEKNYRVLFDLLDDLKLYMPDDERIIALRTWCEEGHWDTPVMLPEVPGAPRWALLARDIIKHSQGAAHWWAENRQLPNGEFGDNLNDDTDMVNVWPAIGMVLGPDETLKRSIKAVAQVVYDNGNIVHGLNRVPMDTLHAYEEGINVQPQAHLMDYGNPLYLERMMEAAKRVDEDLLAVNPLGHKLMQSYDFGAYEVVTGPDSGDSLNGWLVAHPALAVLWYNRNPRCLEMLQDWADAWIEIIEKNLAAGGPATRGIRWRDEKVTRTWGLPYSSRGFYDSLLALWEITGDEKYVRLGQLWLDQDELRTPSWDGAYAFWHLADRGKLDKGIGWLRDHAEAQLPEAGLDALGNVMMMKYRVWEQTGDLAELETGLEACARRWQLTYPVYTWWEPQNDRMWYSDGPALAMYLGDIPAKRNFPLWPRHHVSWEGLSDFAAFVVEKSDEHLKVLLFNFEQAEAEGLMRVWRLAHGTYRVRLGPDADGDWQMDTVASEGSLELFKSAAVPVRLPPRGLMVLQVDQVQAVDDDLFSRPDLALSPEEVIYDAERETLEVPVHNVGGGSAPATVVRLVGLEDNVLREAQIGPLEAPLDLMPRVQVVTWTDLAGLDAPGCSVICLLYTSPSPRDQRGSRMPSSA